MFDCTTDNYDQIYARWLEGPGTLLDLAKYKPEDSLLDLCGGTGAVSIEALRRGGNKVSLLDLNPRIQDPWAEKVKVYKGKAEEANKIVGNQFDVIVCRQAIGYLDIKKTFRAVMKLLRLGGRFVFNSFAEPRFSVKTYDKNYTRFAEVSIPLWKWVAHIQYAKRIGTDISLFRFHTARDINSALISCWDPMSIFDEWCRVDVFREGRSLRWICTKEGDEINQTWPF